MTNKAPKFERVLSIFSVASYVDIVSYCRVLITNGMQSESIQLKVVTTSYYTRLVKFLWWKSRLLQPSFNQFVGFLFLFIPIILFFKSFTLPL